MSEWGPRDWLAVIAIATAVGSPIAQWAVLRSQVNDIRVDIRKIWDRISGEHGFERRLTRIETRCEERTGCAGEDI